MALRSLSWPQLRVGQERRSFISTQERSSGRSALLIVLAAQLAICLFARAEGPLAISDDDYARVVIAQQFADAPRLDPSGTSWLPLPFLLGGIPMLFFGASLELARGVAIVLALASAALLYLSARVLRGTPAQALLAALLAAALPSSARLSVATVPEYLSATLLVVVYACTFRLLLTEPGRDKKLSTTKLAWLAALTAMAASACRYEAWPVAIGLSGVLSYRALRGLAPSRKTPPVEAAVQPILAAAALSVSFIAAWLVYGVLHHGNALFFIARVTDYKRALGAPTPHDLLETLWAYPHLLILEEPAAGMLLALGLTAWALTRRPPTTDDAEPRLVSPSPARPNGRGHHRAATLLASALTLPGLLLVTLIVGSLGDGAPTHHPGRALLSLWLFAIVGGTLLLARSRPSSTWLRRGLQALLVGGLLYIAQLSALSPQGFAERAEEETVGRELRRIAPSETVVIVTPDYGYLAVQAAAGSPGRFHVVDRHDPRDVAPASPAKHQALSLARQRNASWIVAPSEWQLPGFSQTLTTRRLSIYERTNDPRPPVLRP